MDQVLLPEASPPSAAVLKGKCSDDFFPDFPSCFRIRFRRISSSVTTSMRVLPMRVASSTVVGTSRASPNICLSRWTNEPLPDLRNILCSHDVARLTRRPRWLICGLALIGRFPPEKRYRGRPIGWCRSDVLDWMSRDLAVAPMKQECLNSYHRCSRRHPRQTCLPLDCAMPRPSPQKCSRGQEQKTERRPEAQP